MSLSRALMLQALMLSTVPYALFRIGCLLWDRSTALLTAVLAAFSQLLILNSVNLTREGPANLFSVWGLLALLALSENGTNGVRVFLAAVTGVLCSYAGSIDAVFLPLFLVCFLLCLAAGRQPIARRATTFGVLIAAFITTKIAFEYAAMGHLTVAGRDIAVAELVACTNPYAGRLCGMGVNLVSHPTSLLRGFAGHPLVVAKLFVMKLLTDFAGFFLVGYAGDFDPTLLVRDSLFAHSLSVYAYVFAFGGFAGMLGTAFKHFDLRRACYLIVVIGFSAAYIVLSYGQTRFRATIQPLLLLLLAYGIVSFLRWAAPRALDGWDWCAAPAKKD